MKAIWNPTIRGRGVKDLKTAQTGIPLTGRYNPGDDRLATQPYMLFNTINTEAGEKSVKQPIYGPLLQTVRNEKGERRAVPTAQGGIGIYGEQIEGTPEGAL